MVGSLECILVDDAHLPSNKLQSIRYTRCHKDATQLYENPRVAYHRDFQSTAINPAKLICIVVGYPCSINRWKSVCSMGPWDQT